nr:DUF3592 domain-containing protein [Lentilitoribacter sp. Alg239-R112]
MIFYVFGFTAMLGGGGFMTYNLRFLIVSEKTVGTVVSTSEVRRSKTDIDLQRRNNVSTIDYSSNVLDVEFFDISDNRHVVMFDISEDTFDIGERVPLAYRFRTPEDAKMSGFRRMFLGPIILVFFGSLFWFVGKLGFVMLE